MPIKYLPLLAILAIISTATLPSNAQMSAPPAQSHSETVPAGILTREQAAAILPPSVFFRGQSATIQGRNSAGIKFSDGKLILVTLVDTSGYSSALQQTYQAYLLTEVPIKLGEHTLPPGAYGFGYVENNRMVVMDIGGNEIVHDATTRDAALQRPTPLQILADPTAPQHFRLYLGRSFVTLVPVNK